VQRQFNGASSHLEYQEAIKKEASNAAMFFTADAQSSRNSTIFVNQVVKGMHAALAVKGIEVCKKKCYNQGHKTINNNGVSISPQKHGGGASPSHLEKKIATIVCALREWKFSVFPEEVRKWAAKAIEGTKYAACFIEGTPTVGW